jgi:phosphoribosylformylglycinamidine cyclo-ligase
MKAEMKYDKRGVSSKKEDVHQAIRNLDKGLYPNAFCKVIPDVVAGDKDHACIMHADTAGTKTVLAYLQWKESGDISVWENIVKDAIVMNTDDMACAGVTDNFVFSSTLGRNRSLISGEVLSRIINHSYEYLASFSELGIHMFMSGGESADVGDIVRSIDVGFTAFARIRRSEIRDISIRAGDMIVALSSSGKAIYESDHNSGIACNGLTFARHELLEHAYAERFPETFDPSIAPEYLYSGTYTLGDTSPYSGRTIAELLLSPTRTYLPVLKRIYAEIDRDSISGIIHCTGGGQTKVLHFVDHLHVIKNNMFEVPEIFRIIQKVNNCDWREMYQVFNMGHRLEIYCNKSIASGIVKIAEAFDIEADIIGHVELSKSKKLSILTDQGDFFYE